MIRPLRHAPPPPLSAAGTVSAGLKSEALGDLLDSGKRLKGCTYPAIKQTKRHRFPTAERIFPGGERLST